MPSAPNSLDPRLGTDEISQKVAQLVFDSLLTLDERLNVVPGLAESWEHPDPLTYSCTCGRACGSTTGTS